MGPSAAPLCHALRVPMKVEAKCVAALDLLLTDANDGTRLDDGVLWLLQGSEEAFPGLHDLVLGVEANETFEGVVQPEFAFGLRVASEPIPVPRKEIGPDARPGLSMRVDGNDGKQVTLYVTRVEGKRAWVDVQHPWAGRTVRVKGTVLFVRYPTLEELEHGHVHGPGHHHHD